MIDAALQVISKTVNNRFKDSPTLPKLVCYSCFPFSAFFQIPDGAIIG